MHIIFSQQDLERLNATDLNDPNQIQKSSDQFVEALIPLISPELNLFVKALYYPQSNTLIKLFAYKINDQEYSIIGDQSSMTIEQALKLASSLNIKKLRQNIQKDQMANSANVSPNQIPLNNLPPSPQEKKEDLVIPTPPIVQKKIEEPIPSSASFELMYQRFLAHKSPNVKRASLQAYKYCYDQMCKIIKVKEPFDQYNNKSKMIQLCETLRNQGYSDNKINKLLKFIIQVVDWSVSIELIDRNNLDHMTHIYKNNIHKPREALNCEMFNNINDAEKSLTELFSFLVSHWQKDRYAIRMFAYLIHLTLGTRVMETARVIIAYVFNRYQIFSIDETSVEKIPAITSSYINLSHANSDQASFNPDLNKFAYFIEIETKKTKVANPIKFKIPISHNLKVLLDVLKELLLRKLDHSKLDHIYQLIRKNNQSEITSDMENQLFDFFFEPFMSDVRKNLKQHKIQFHGSRALYRTVIDFLIKNDGYRAAKEYYLDHSIDSYVQSRYHRNNYLIERLYLQEHYLLWLIKCFNMIPNHYHLQVS